MKCIRCEVARARIKSEVLLAFGWTLPRIAEYLTNCYGTCYYVENGVLFRVSEIPPHTPYTIKVNPYTLGFRATPQFEWQFLYAILLMWAILLLLSRS